MWLADEFGNDWLDGGTDGDTVRSKKQTIASQTLPAPPLQQFQ
ncbi:hypothetical protein OAJ60_00865 [Planctomycetaceae bacterium]|nr:hypothetical protein [Planctomycetaceae bacterium]